MKRGCFYIVHRNYMHIITETNRVPTFQDWQNSMTFPGFSVNFQVFFHFFKSDFQFVLIYIHKFTSFHLNKKLTISILLQINKPLGGISSVSRFHIIFPWLLLNFSKLHDISRFSRWSGKPDQRNFGHQSEQWDLSVMKQSDDLSCDTTNFFPFIKKELLISLIKELLQAHHWKSFVKRIFVPMF